MHHRSRAPDRLASLMQARRNVFIRLPGGQYGLCSATNRYITVHVGHWHGKEFIPEEKHLFNADDEIFDGRGWDVSKLTTLLEGLAPRHPEPGQEANTMKLSDSIIAHLESYDLKHTGGGKYRCKSPLRNDSDTRSFALTIEGDDRGMWYDHVKEEGGSLFGLARLLGIDIPSRLDVENTKRAYHGIQDYAKAHGLEGYVLEAYQWHEVNHNGRPALAIPTRTGTRYRFIDGEKKKPTYINPQGYKRCWYGLSNKIQKKVKDGSLLVLVNGEISTVAGQHWGFAAIAMTSGEKAEIPTDLLNELKGSVGTCDVIVALDCDNKGRSAGRGLAKQLSEAGFNARAVDLALGDGGDFADFCMLWREDSESRLGELEDLPPEVDDVPDRSWKVVTVKDILKAAPIEWLVPELIPDKMITLVYGESGTYKSFFTLHQALTLAEKMNVVYVAAEGESGYRQRLEAWFKFHQRFTEKITFVLGSINMFDDTDLYEFSKVSEMYNPRVIVIDTLSMSIGEADTNSGRDMVHVFKACKRIIAHMNCAVVLVHHTNAEGRRATGSQRIKDSVDMMIRLSHDDDRIKVECHKSKDTDKFEPFYLKEVVVPLGYQDNLGRDVSSLVLLPSEKVVREDDLTDVQKAVLGEIQLDPDQSYATIADNIETSRGSVASAMRGLMKKNYIVRSANGLQITESGIKALTGGESSDSTDSTDSTESPDSTVIQDGTPYDSDDSGDSDDSVIQFSLMPSPTNAKNNPYNHQNSKY